MDVIREIRALKQRWGDSLILLTHHYQRAEIVDLGDRAGDSHELSRAAAGAERARFIVFCGVRFMAEAAEILRRPEQRVIHPDESAGCPMAEMAPADSAEQAWEVLQRVRGVDRVMPVVYMNSSAALKALVGRSGGCVCTSSNAGRAFAWAFSQRPAVFFFPDEHLGRNTANLLGVRRDQVVLWNPELPDGGLSSSEIERARVILWKGFCHVHTAFSPPDVHAARARFPGACVLVHPECPEEVVAVADGSGSTSFLVKAVREAAPGSVLVIGTEVNLVSRLARDFPDRTVVPLKRSLCGNMFRISPQKLLTCLRDLEHADAVVLPPEVKDGARIALERMLAI